MIQFNLLPDVKMDFIRAKKNKSTVLSVAFISVAATICLVVLLFTVVNFAQKTHLNNLADDIDSLSKELQDTPELGKVLTVQNQLNRITEIHDKKPAATRLSQYLTQVTPVDVAISELEVDYENNTMIIKGAAGDLKIVNKYVDTLKFTDYKTASGTQAKAFSDVVLKNFGRDDNGATYEISLTYDPVIFSNAEKTTLVVPTTTTTRSILEKPDPLFQALESDSSDTETEQ